MCSEEFVENFAWCIHLVTLLVGAIQSTTECLALEETRRSLNIARCFPRILLEGLGSLWNLNQDNHSQTLQMLFCVELIDSMRRRIRFWSAGVEY
jgi:hypothetical protein